MGLKSTEYIAYVQPCVVCGKEAEPHHLYHIQHHRKRESWRHFTILWLCRVHHAEIHTDIDKFEAKYKINVFKVALKILAQWLMEQ